MDPKELRIGNLVTTINRSGKVHLPTGITERIGAISFFEVELFDYKNPFAQQIGRKEEIQNLSPIELIEEWLLKLGFKKFPNTNWWILDNSFQIKIRFDEPIEGYPNPVSIWVGNEIAIHAGYRYVHQLQNLWYCIYFKELEIK